jgi:predicted DCC family thiol-disulfide oxidoreductase YuxK
MPDLVFYDADCAICCAFRDFIQERDKHGRLQHEPLGSEAHAERVSDELRAEDPDSVIVVTESGTELIRTPAVRHILTRLGAPWSWLSRLLGLLPDALTDRTYREIAARRRGLLGTKQPHT